MATKSNDQPVFDVSKPGKSMPSPTSRPLISSHGPIMKDNMVKEDKQESKPEKIAVTIKKVVAPIAEETTEDKPVKDEPDPATAEEKPVQKKSEPTVPETTEASSTETPEDNQPAEDADEAALSQADTIKPPAGPNKEELERLSAIEKHIEDKTYYVPINQVTRRRTARRVFVSLVAVIILLAAAGYIAMQQGLFELNDINLPW